MIPAATFTSKVTIYRRTAVEDVTRDSLNNPTYGAPVTGSGWSIQYDNMPVTLAFVNKAVDFKEVGERIVPTGTMYYDSSYTLQIEDRVVTSDNIQYIVIGIGSAYVMPGVLSHYEARLQLAG